MANSNIKETRDQRNMLQEQEEASFKPKLLEEQRDIYFSLFFIY